MSKNTTEFLQSLVKSVTGNTDPEKIEILTNDLKKKYGLTMDETNAALEAPRTSTASESIDNARQFGEVLRADERAGLVNYKERAGIDQDQANQVSERKVRTHGGIIDNHVGAVQALQGGTQMDAMRLGYDTGDGRHQREIDYREGLNSQIIGLEKQRMAQEQSLANRGFIADLARTAGMLFTN